MQDLKDAAQFVTDAMVGDGFKALHDIATDPNVSPRERIDAARELIAYGGVKHPYYGPPYPDADPIPAPEGSE